MGRRECTPLGRLEVSLEEDVKHNSPVMVLKEKAHPQHLSHGLDTQGLGDMPQAGAMAIYLCVPGTQRPCHILGVQYTFIEFDLK